jgi:hypothetical protein
MGVPAWKSHPSWFLVADGDQAIPPDAERQFAARMGATTVEVPTNHVAMVSHSDDVVPLIETAAEAVEAANEHRRRPRMPRGYGLGERHDRYLRHHPGQDRNRST